MNNFFIILKKNYINKYQRWLPDNKFLKVRSFFLKKLLNYKSSKKIILSKKKFQTNSINTFEFLSNVNPNQISNRERKIILNLFNKYNYSLKLKKKYNNKVKKITNKNTNFSSYIYLGNHLVKLENLTDVQKLNCILKINDITLLNINSKDILNLIPYIKKNIKFEISKTIKYAKKSINNYC